MTLDPEMLAGLDRYRAARVKERAETVDAMLAALRPRERHLVREVAVFAFVQGHRAGGGRYEQDAFPRDADIVRCVLGDAHAFSDLYPWLARLRRMVTR